MWSRVRLFHDWQFLLNGTALAKFVGCGVFSCAWICRFCGLFVPCCSEWNFGRVEGCVTRASVAAHPCRKPGVKDGAPGRITGWRQALQVAILSDAEQRDLGKRLSPHIRAAPFAETSTHPTRINHTGIRGNSP